MMKEKLAFVFSSGSCQQVAEALRVASLVHCGYRSSFHSLNTMHFKISNSKTNLSLHQFFVIASVYLCSGPFRKKKSTIYQVPQTCTMGISDALSFYTIRNQISMWATMLCRQFLGKTKKKKKEKMESEITENFLTSLTVKTP